MKCFTVFQNNNPQRLPVQFFDVAPQSGASIGLNLDLHWIRDNIQAPLDLNIRPLPKHLLSKVSRGLHSR